jgi:hypothetical protein
MKYMKHQLIVIFIIILLHLWRFILKWEICNAVTNLHWCKKTIDLLTTKNYIFIFDNVSFHHSKKVLELINNSGHKYIFTPPYSPNLNPIENVNSIVKHEIKNIKINEITNENILIQTKEEIKNKINNNNFFIKNKIKKEKEKNKAKYKCKKITKDDYKKNIKEILINNKKIKKELAIKIKNNDKTKIKEYIKIAIEKFNVKYKNKIINIFKHAFNFNHKKIETELRDRINFIK